MDSGSVIFQVQTNLIMFMIKARPSGFKSQPLGNKHINSQDEEQSEKQCPNDLPNGCFKKVF